jgi:hypothetical protein
MKYLTICGPKQVGKDTLARMIDEELDAAGGCGPYAAIIHFADALKRMCGMMAQFSEKTALSVFEEDKNRATWFKMPQKVNGLWTPNPLGEPMSFRDLLKFVGTDLIRNQLDPDLWARIVFSPDFYDDESKDYISYLIIADCRFPNELRYARQNGKTIRVKRDTGFQDSHISETALDEVSDDQFDYIVDNNGTFDDLRDAARVIVKCELCDGQ